MTILPKKKNPQAKSDNESKAIENSSHLSSHGGVTTQGNDVLIYVNSQNWSASNSRDDKRQTHNTASRYEDSIENTSNHCKRRHRASPHSCIPRNVRNKLRDRERERGNGSASPAYPSTSTSNTSGCSSPLAGPSVILSDDVSGYNSSDEYSCSLQSGKEDIEEKERWFEKKMRKKGFIIKQMAQDGACLFRAVADQVYGDQDMHNIAQNRDYFSQYVTEDFNTYVDRKREPHVHGNHIEIQAMSELFNRPIEVYCYTIEPINIFHGMHTTGNEPMRLSYHRGTHYNSVIDPWKATIGVGLGLPGLVPGMAQQKLIGEAVLKSEELALEQAMLEDKLKATDWEATSEALEEQVARESYLQWLRDTDKCSRGIRSSTITSGAISPIREGFVEESCHQDVPTTSQNINENNRPNKKTSLEEWENADILAKVLAASQQEYLESLKQNVTKESDPGDSSTSS